MFKGAIFARNLSQAGPDRQQVISLLLSDTPSLCQATIQHGAYVYTTLASVILSPSEPIRVRARAAKFLLGSAKSGVNLSSIADLLRPTVERELDADIRADVLAALRESCRRNIGSRSVFLNAVPHLETIQIS